MKAELFLFTDCSRQTWTFTNKLERDKYAHEHLHNVIQPDDPEKAFRQLSTNALWQGPSGIILINQTIPVNLPARIERKNEPIVVTVTGKGHFPFDMLRYDQAVPVTGDDVFNMLRDDYVANRDIRLHVYKISGPTHGRWSSFGWQIKEEE